MFSYLLACNEGRSVLVFVAFLFSFRDLQLLTLEEAEVFGKKDKEQKALRALQDKVCFIPSYLRAEVGCDHNIYGYIL